jgi:hypothetical protein
MSDSQNLQSSHPEDDSSLSSGGQNDDRKGVPLRTRLLILRARTIPFYKLLLEESIYAVRSELRSLWPRILLARRTNPIAMLLYQPLEVDPADAAGERLIVCKREYARKSDMRRLLAKRPWTTAVDLRFWREGFEVGAEWALHENGIPHSCKRDKADTACPPSEYYSYPDEEE